MTTTGVHREVEHRLRAANVRFTRGRRAVIEELAGAEGPRSAAELFDVLDGGVPLSSLYRTLSVLESAGVVKPHHGARDVVRYELADWLSGHHHHLVCTGCGRVDDVALSPHHEETLEAMAADVADAAGFSGVEHGLEIEGTCEDCAA